MDTGSIPDPNSNLRIEGHDELTTSAASGIETVYELTNNTNDKGRQTLESPTSHVVSERVQNLAAQIYHELQRIISRFSGDESIVAGVMPLVVNVLESLDLSIIENQQLQVELELCKDDNEQLVTAFDKEKSFKKKIEQKLIEFEFQTEEEKSQYQQKIDSLENIVKMVELKAKNSSDHATRLEDKETELKTEYQKLHTRYTELLRNHCDLMERVKVMCSNEDAVNHSGPVSLSSINIKSFLNKKNEFESDPTESGATKNEALLTSSIACKQAWEEPELSMEDQPSIIEDVEEIPKEPQSLTVGQSQQTKSRAKEIIKDYPSNVTDTFFAGMENEIENLISENNELLATKNALNIVKDDLIAKVDELQSELMMAKEEVQQITSIKGRLKSKISQLEEDMKKIKDELEETKTKLAQLSEDDEEGIPMAQRKRFTRVEMARVLMERNQYKERLIELQEAIRWTELIRASKNEGEKKSAIWKFFSNLFGSNTSASTSLKESPTRLSPSSAAVKYSSNASTVTPALDAMKRRARVQAAGNDLVLLMDSDLTSERARALKNVRAHVNRSNGDRIQAYGWSIAGNQEKGEESLRPSTISGKHKNTSVPVPVYCRPLSGDDIGMKIWCAAAVDLSGGEAGFPGGSDSHEQEKKPDEKSNIPKSKSDLAISDLESELNQALSDQSDAYETKLSTFVWICSVSHSKSKVTIVNIRSNPSEVLDSFVVRTHLLCILSVSGAKVTDIDRSEGITDSGLEWIKVEKPEMGDAFSEKSSNESDKQSEKSQNISLAEEVTETGSEESAVKNETLEKLTEYVAYTQPPSPSHGEEVPSPSSTIYQPMSTCLPTMWLGGQNGIVYVHSSIAQWSHCIASVKLPDSILQIVHYRGRVFIALANGKCCIFTRSASTGEWDLSQYLIVHVGLIATSSAGENTKGSSASTSCYSIRCMEISKSFIWLGYRNLVFILDPMKLQVVHSFPVHPRKESQVRQFASMGDGVWCSLRLDSTLRLYSSLKPYAHLQDLDIEPYVSKMLNPKAFSFFRITALKASNYRLWIGTSNGVILSIPCHKGGNASDEAVHSANDGRIAISSFVPNCNLSSAQLSFHGHKDAVKFFCSTRNLILSGGDGYIDFRLNTEDDSTSLSKGDRSHLIVWEVAI